MKRGPTQTLMAEDREIMDKLHHLQDIGVNVSACLTCAKKIGVDAILEKEGIEVIRWGKRLTELMQNHKHVLSV